MRKIISLIIFISAVGVLFSLSFWQAQRLQWKNEIINRLNKEYNSNPADNNYSFADLSNSNNEQMPLKYGQALGLFDYNKQILLGPKQNEGEIGFNVITPLKMKSDSYILVNRGWIAQDKAQDLHKTNQSGSITVQGLFRKPDWNRFTSNNSPTNNIWMKPDINQISEIKNIKPVASVILYAENSTDNNLNIIIPQNQKWYPRNKHKQYALFWLSMALALITVFGIYFKSKKLN